MQIDDARAGAAKANSAVVEQERGRPVEVECTKKSAKHFYCKVEMAGGNCTNRKCLNSKTMHRNNPLWNDSDVTEARIKIAKADAERGRSQSPSRRKSSRSRSRSSSRVRRAKLAAYEAGLRDGKKAAQK